MNITQYAIKNDRVTLMLLLVVCIMGVRAYLDMPRAEDPGFTIRTAQVVTYFPGASPQRVEELVTDKIEKAVQEIPELKDVQSESRTGVSLVFVNVKPSYKDMRPIWDTLRRKVEDVRSTLPEGVIGPQVNDQFGDVFGTILTITGDGYSYAELKKTAKQVRDELLQLNEVAKVDIYGAQDEQIFVEYNNARLAELGISPQQLAQILAARNIINPGGSVAAGTERLVLEPTGNFESIDDLKQTIIDAPNTKQQVHLGDIVKIYRDYVDPPSAKTTFSGAPALALAMSLREGGNIMQLGEEVEALVSKLRQTYPIGLEFDYVAFQPKQVDKAVNLFIRNLVEAIIIVAAMMFLSLGFSTGLIVSTLVPTCILMTFLIMSWFGIGLDQVSLAALIISLGLLVDNGIVMVDAISVRIRQGEALLEAAVHAANELRVPLLSGTLITCAAFLPIYLAESETGEYTAPLFSVVTISLLSSWVLALTLTPLLCRYFLKAKMKSMEEVYDTGIYRTYRNILLASLRHPWRSVGAMMGLFAISVWLFGFVPQIFFPPTDRNYFTAELALPMGTSIETTEKMIGGFEQYVKKYLSTEATEKSALNEKLKKIWMERGWSEKTMQQRVETAKLLEAEQGITSWSSFIGQSAPRFHIGHDPKNESPEYAFMLLNVSDQGVIDDTIALMEDYALTYPDLRVRIARTDYGPPVEHPIAVRILGSDVDTLFGYVEEVKQKLATMPGVKNIGDNWGVRTKKIVVKINQPRARRAGVTSSDIATSLRAGLSGLELTQYREGTEVIPITLRSVAADRQDLSKLESINVSSQATGKSVSLKQVADIQIVWEPAKILRRDLLKSVTVSADLDPGLTAVEVTDQLFPWLEEESKKWKTGYKYQTGGEFETSDEANQSIVNKIPLAGFIIILLLVAEFNSLRRTVIHLSTVIMGIIGVVFGLLVTGSYFGFMAFLGVIALAGVEVGHAIVLLDRIHIEMVENKRTAQDALVHAAQNRFRPIYLTAATAAGGMIPLWLFGGPMWEPMAIVLIFGLLFATILTLGVLPVLYSIFHRVSFERYEYKG